MRNSNEEWLNGWQMQMHNPFTAETIAQATEGQGRTTFNNLFAGTYTVCEVQQTGWFVITPNALSTQYQQPCYTFAVAPGTGGLGSVRNSSSPLVAAASDTPIIDIVVCDLPPNDDNGNEVGAERDPWEEEEDAGNTMFLPVVDR